MSWTGDFILVNRPNAQVIKTINDIHIHCCNTGERLFVICSVVILFIWVCLALDREHLHVYEVLLVMCCICWGWAHTVCLEQEVECSWQDRMKHGACLINPMLAHPERHRAWISQGSCVACMIRNEAKRCDMKRYNPKRNNMIRCETIWYDTFWYVMILYGYVTLNYATLGYITIRYNMIRYD